MSNMTSVVRTPVLHLYAGMIEYNMLFKGAQTLGQETTEENIPDAFDHLALLVRNVMKNYDPKRAGTSQIRWRSLPWVLHYQYQKKHDLPYLSVEKHFMLSKKYKTGMSYDLLELRNPAWTVPVEKALTAQPAISAEPLTDTWNTYFSFVPQDKTWIDDINFANVHLVSSHFDEIFDRYQEDYENRVGPELDPEQNTKINRHCIEKLAKYNWPHLLALFLAYYYSPEVCAHLDITQAELSQMFYFDTISQFQKELAYWGFYAAHQTFCMPEQSYFVTQLVLGE